jgi:hypothetical protein
MSVSFLVGWWPAIALAMVAVSAEGRRVSVLVSTVICALVMYSFSQRHVGQTIGTMAFFDRYFLGVLPCLAALAGLGADTLRQRSGRWMFGVVGLCLLGWPLMNPLATVEEVLACVTKWPYPFHECRFDMFSYLNKRHGDGLSVATSDVGKNGYLTSGTIYDIIGLSSGEFTRKLKRDGDRNLDRIVAQRPKVRLVLAENRDNGWIPFYDEEQALQRKPELRSSYRLTRRFCESTAKGQHSFVILERVDSGRAKPG